MFNSGTPCVAVTNTFPTTLYFLRAMWGGTVRTLKTKKKVRPQYQWAVFGDGARAVCQATIPHLREKKRQAVILGAMSGWPARSAMRASLKAELNDLKKVVYG